MTTHDTRSTVLDAVTALLALRSLTPETVGAAFGPSLALTNETPHLLTYAARPEEGPFTLVELLVPAPGATHRHIRAIADLRRDLDVTREDLQALVGRGRSLGAVLDAVGGAETWSFAAGAHTLYLTFSTDHRQLRSICLAPEG